MEPTETAPMAAAALTPYRCPDMAVSTKPTSGTEMLASMLGTDSLSISLLSFLSIIA